MHTDMKQHKQQGLGIVEVMVALLLSGLLIAGVTQIYTGSQAAYRLQDQMSRTQENARFAFHFLSRELRMAGYSGCRRDVPIESVLNPVASDDELSFLNGFQPGIMGYSFQGGGWSPNLPGSLSAIDPLPNTDVVEIRNSGTDQVAVADPYHVIEMNAAKVFMDQNPGFEPGDILLVSDCAAGTVFEVTNAFDGGGSQGVVANKGKTITVGNESSALGSFGEGATVSRATSVVYYVAQGASGEPALFRRMNNRPVEELVEGIERLRFTYGIGDGVMITDYRTAAEVDAANQWDRVMSVQISAVVRGNRDETTDEPQAYTFDGEQIVPADRRLRYVVGTTATLRNRVR